MKIEDRPPNTIQTLCHPLQCPNDQRSRTDWISCSISSCVSHLSSKLTKTRWMAWSCLSAHSTENIFTFGRESTMNWASCTMQSACRRKALVVSSSAESDGDGCMCCCQQAGNSWGTEILSKFGVTKNVGKPQAQPARSKFWQVHAMNFFYWPPFSIQDICIIQNVSMCLVSMAWESKASFVYFCLPSLLMTMVMKIQPLWSIKSL